MRKIATVAKLDEPKFSRAGAKGEAKGRALQALGPGAA